MSKNGSSCLGVHHLKSLSTVGLTSIWSSHNCTHAIPLIFLFFIHYFPFCPPYCLFIFGLRPIFPIKSTRFVDGCELTLLYMQQNRNFQFFLESIMCYINQSFNLFYFYFFILWINCYIGPPNYQIINVLVNVIYLTLVKITLNF